MGANQLIPGGGYLHGSRAQEECLWRCSLNASAMHLSVAPDRIDNDTKSRSERLASGRYMYATNRKYHERIGLMSHSERSQSKWVDKATSDASKGQAPFRVNLGQTFNE